MKQRAKTLWEKNDFVQAIQLLEQNLALCQSLNNTLQLFKTQYKFHTGTKYQDADARRLEEFTQWAKSSGTEFGKIRIKQFAPDYRGVCAQKQIKAEEQILSVPEELIITEEKGKNTKLGRLVAESGMEPDYPFLFYLAIFILEEMMKKDSLWKPYMDVYPKTASNFPIFYTNEEKALLVGTSMLDKLNLDSIITIEEYSELIDKVPEFEAIEIDDYIRLMQLTGSRLFAVEMKGKKERIMVPVADMFNHLGNKPKQTSWNFYDDDNAFIVKAKRAIAPGEEVI